MELCKFFTQRSLMKRQILCIATLVASTGAVFAQGPGPMDPPSGNPTTITNATGTISQVNYGTDGIADGFLLGTNVLLIFPGFTTGGIAALGAVGNSVTYSGEAVANSSGFETVTVTSFTN